MKKMIDVKAELRKAENNLKLWEEAKEEAA